MKIVLSVEDREEAYRQFVVNRFHIGDYEELVVNMPSYSTDYTTVEIVKKPPQKQPQE